MKFLYHQKRFKGERSANSESIFTNNEDQIFFVKGNCKASTKKELISLGITYKNVTVKQQIHHEVTCTAVKSAYYNHIMTLLLEVAKNRVTLKTYIRIY